MEAQKYNPFAEYEEAFKRLQEQDEQAQKDGKLVGRYIDHPFADGRAYYKITKENKSSVVIEVVRGIGDDWSIPAWGDKATIKKTLAQDFLRRRDALNILFSKRW